MNKRLLVLAALAVVVWIAVVLLPESKEQDGEVDAQWPALAVAEVKQVELFAPAGHFNLVKQENGDWLLQAKGKEPLRADGAKVEALLSFIKGQAPIRRLEEPGATADKERLAGFGLDKPESMVTLQADRDWRIALGDKNPSGDGVYALSSLEPGILLLPMAYAEQFAKEPAQYYDLGLLDMTAEDVSKIRATGEVEWEITRQEGDEGWAFTWPEALVDYPVAKYEANIYAHDLVSLRGDAYLPQWSESEVGETARLEFSVWRKDVDEPETLSVVAVPAVVDNASLEADGPKAKTGYVALSSWQKAPVALDAAAWGKLFKTAFFLRQRSVLPQGVFGQGGQGDLTRMELVPAEKDRYKSLQAVKGEKLWEDAQGEKLVGMDVLLWRLTDLKYEGPESASLPPSAHLSLSWDLYGKNGEKIIAVNFHEDPQMPGERCWVSLDVPGQDKNTVYYPVARELLDDLRSRLAAAETNNEAPAANPDAEARNATAKE